MPYVRAKGNQICIVHGERDSTTKQVQQRVLFTLYSKAEAIAALGGARDQFRRVVESEHQDVKIDWKKIDVGINEQMGVLPDLYAYRDQAETGFRDALVGFAKELLVADPQNLVTSARLLQAHHHELEYLRELIDWRLKLRDQDESAWNKDNPFFWRASLQRREVPTDCWEQLGALYGKGEHEKCGALAQLLIDAWPNFAVGHNYLGLIARDRGDFDAAVEHFERGLTVGRTLFPKRIRKDSWWSNTDTRPYIRSLVWLAQTHNRRGDQSMALTYCDRLEQECAQDITAATTRGPTFLNAGLWGQAAKAARYVVGIYPQESFTLAFALHELGETDEAMAYLLHGALNHPRTALMLAGLTRATAPASFDEAEDHNLGVDLLRDIHQYLTGRGTKARSSLKALLQREPLAALLDEADEVRTKWHTNRSTDRTWFDRMTTMSSVEFAREIAKGLSMKATRTAPQSQPLRLATRGPLEQQ